MQSGERARSTGAPDGAERAERAEPAFVPADAADRLTADEAVAVVEAFEGEAPGGLRVVVIGDDSGRIGAELVERAGDRIRDVRLFNDAVTGEASCDAAIAAAIGTAGAVDVARPSIRRMPALDAELLDGAHVVALRLPKHLAELDEIARLAASCGDPAVRLVAGGRLKHMSRGMNGVLERSFSDVRASLARQKSRVLHAEDARRDGDGIASASAPTPVHPAYPVVARLRERVGEIDLDLEVAAHGGAFAGARLDLGTRELVRALPGIARLFGPAPGTTQENASTDLEYGDLFSHSPELCAPVPAPALTIVDLGCGTGILSVCAAHAFDGSRVIATDRSWAAVASARETARLAGLADRVEARREDAGAGVPDASVDLVLCNPPFHDRHELAESMSDRLFAEAARMLRPGGLLAVVHNAHLPHRAAVSRLVGPVRELARTPKFTVIVAERRGEGPGGGRAGVPSSGERGRRAASLRTREEVA